MMSIEIDFDIYKALTARRQTEQETYNDVLRELLGLGPKKMTSPQAGAAGKDDGWVSKGVYFPLGTEFRASYKGKNYYGKVESGAFVVSGRRFDSPSAAAVDITGNPVNGWTFWECRLPSRSSWQMIKALRKPAA